MKESKVALLCCSWRALTLQSVISGPVLASGKRRLCVFLAFVKANGSRDPGRGPGTCVGGHPSPRPLSPALGRCLRPSAAAFQLRLRGSRVSGPEACAPGRREGPAQRGQLAHPACPLRAGPGRFLPYIIPTLQRCFPKSNNPVPLHYHKSLCNPAPSPGEQDPGRATGVTVGAETPGAPALGSGKRCGSLPGRRVPATGHLARDVFSIFHFNGIGGGKGGRAQQGPSSPPLVWAKESVSIPETKAKPWRGRWGPRPPQQALLPPLCPLL